MKNILYITYDGICEPLGISQSLSYLEKLSPEFNIHIISYEKKKEINNSKNFKLIKKRLAKAGITCSFLKYHINSNYFAKIYDIFIGILITLFVTNVSWITFLTACFYGFKNFSLFYAILGIVLSISIHDREIL